MALDLSSLSPQQREKGRQKILAYQKNPLSFCTEVLGQKNYWPKQIDVLQSVANHKYTEVHSGHDVGKTYVAADVAIWFLYTFSPSIVITTAPTWRQVEKVLWGEINAHWLKSFVPLGGKALETEIKLGPKWYAMGFSSDKADAFQGFHEKNILVIEDEPSGISDEVDIQIQSILANENARILKIGNPTRKTGHFAASISDDKYNHIHISCWDSPNVKAGRSIFPGLVTKDWCEDRLKEWGEDSPVYQSRVLGLVPSEDADTLIKLEWIEAALLRHAKGTDHNAVGSTVVSCDVARFGDNLTVVICRRGNRILSVENFSRQDTEVTADVIYERAMKYGADLVVVDDNGVGGGVTDKLKVRYKMKNVVAENAGETAEEIEKYSNRKSELAARVRDAFRFGKLDIPDVDKLVFQCNNQFFDLDSKQRLRVMSKTLLKKKGLPSSDFFEALTLSYAKEIPDSLAREQAQYLMEFSDATHIQEIDPESFVTGVSKYCVLVPGTNGPSALLWALADRDGKIFIYKEMLVTRSMSSAIDEAIQDAESSGLLQVEERVVPKFALPEETQKNRYHLLEQLEDYDYLFEEIEFDFDTAALLLREGLKFNRKFPVVNGNVPYIFIHPSCLHTIQAVKYYLNPKQFENDVVYELFHKAVGTLVLSEPQWSKAVQPKLYFTKSEDSLIEKVEIRE